MAGANSVEQPWLCLNFFYVAGKVHGNLLPLSTGCHSQDISLLMQLLQKCRAIATSCNTNGIPKASIELQPSQLFRTLHVLLGITAMAYLT